MIQFFIKIANNWFGKVIFGFLLFGMVFVLGYGGLTEQGRRPDQAITVGDKALSMQQLDSIFRQETQKLSSMMGGQYISPKQAIEMGLLDNIIRQQVNEMVMTSIKDDLGLNASNQAVQKYVENNPAFADVTGKFDRNLFAAYLRQMRISESELAKKLQNELASRHLTHAVQGLSYAPPEMVKQAYAYQNEKRNVTALLVDPAKIKLQKQPSQEELREYYEAYTTDRFMTPEYRAFSYLHITPDSLVNIIKVSDEEVEAVLSDRKAQFETPEKRLVSQMFFNDEEKAKEILKKVTPDNFEKLALDELKQPKDVTDFGYVASTDLMEELAEPVFAASKNQVIGPIASANGFHLMLIRDIQKAQSLPLSEVREKIKKQLATEKAYGALEETVRHLEESLGEGKTLSETATELNLSLEKVAGTDIAGIQKNGRELSVSLASQDLLKNLFTLKIGESTPLFEVADGYIVAELTDIIPVGVKPFESVQTELIQIWTQEHQKDLLQQKADEIFKRVQNGDSLSTQGVFGNFKVIKDDAATRIQSQSLPLPVLKAVFNQKEGIEGLTQTQTDNSIYITLVKHISKPDFKKDKGGFNRVKDTVLEQTGSELLESLMGTYADQLGVSVNDSEIKKIFAVYETE